MQKSLIVVITGTNKGLGLDLVKLFLNQNKGNIIYATSREEQNIARKRWQSIDPNGFIKNRFLDISQKKSIQNFAKTLIEQKIKIDILINNAGICDFKENGQEFPNASWARECLNVNVLGHIHLTQLLLPLFSQNVVVANVGSALGALEFHPANTQQRFQDNNLNRQDIIQAVEQYINEVQSKNLVNFSKNVYGTSKMLLGAWSRFVLQKKMLKDKQVAITVSPGLCLTPMTQNFITEQMKAIAHSSQSGALRMFQSILRKDLDSQIFYHRNRISNYIECGINLPRDQ